MNLINRSPTVLDWEASAVQMQERSERRAWNVAKAATVVAIACAAAFAAMVPFYRVVPMPVEVNKLTGDAQVVDVLDARHVPMSEVLDKHWVTTYVQSRERYFWPFLQLDYDSVRSMSDGQALKDFDGVYSGPNALDKTLGADIQRRIKILSTTLPQGEPGRAVVRFMQTTINHGEEERPACFLATIGFEYKPRFLQKEKEAVANPLGFKVTTYSRDADYGVCAEGTAPGGVKAGTAATGASAANAAPMGVPPIQPAQPVQSTVGNANAGGRP
ncbi:virB8 family protein [Burkholderia ubonensis]|uniref:virB8 family protein n=1 Tax=Burkholderia ubonensis TaxID=101571 RepID=UPI0007C6DA33